ncbi:DUF4214 domain-containing protein [Rhodomicrobium sp.]|uniref:DUF4214 domain-containing protein n=1 Tax=Rhodomicrobium sp. TaxID=2720632 RepID=UPI0039E5B054
MTVGDFNDVSGYGYAGIDSSTGGLPGEVNPLAAYTNPSRAAVYADLDNYGNIPGWVDTDKSYGALPSNDGSSFNSNLFNPNAIPKTLDPSLLKTLPNSTTAKGTGNKETGNGASGSVLYGPVQSPPINLGGGNSGNPGGAAYTDLGNYGKDDNAFAGSSNPNGQAVSNGQLGDYGMPPSPESPYISAESLTGATDPNGFLFLTGEAPKSFSQELLNPATNWQTNTDIQNPAAGIGSIDLPESGTYSYVAIGAPDAPSVANLDNRSVVATETGGYVTYINYSDQPGETSNQLAADEQWAESGDSSWGYGDDDGYFGGDDGGSSWGYGDEGGDFGGDYGGDYGDSSWGFGDEGGDFAPVVLDLSGKGINITPLSSSNTFFDMTGDGREHRTAWAGAGNGVLVYDPNNSGQITQQNQVEFTLWDPTASSDMQALKDVFDTNHNGMLDEGDAQFANFKIMVTNADGTTTLETLAQAGIASINLTPDATKIVLPDGSSIDGQTTFTRTDGTTGTAATATFVSETAGYGLKTVTTHNGDGSTTIDNKLLAADGSVASETIQLTSGDGKSRTLSFDDDGDGVIDRTQSDVNVSNANGSITETLSDKTAAGVLVDQTVTNTSADGKTIAITRDINGDGLSDQSETRVKNADGSSSVTISNLDPDGSLKNKTTSSLSADGLTRTVASDFDGNGTTDLTETDATAVNGDGSRTETVTDTSNNGTVEAKTVTATSADGTTKTTRTDYNGDGVFDLTTALVIAIAADHSSTSTVTNTNPDGSLRDKSIVSLSADGLTRITQSDLNGDGVFDVTDSDATVVNGDGSLTETISNTNANGSLRDKTVVTKGTDGVTRTTQIDANGDGVWDKVETVAVSGTGTTDTLSLYNPDGSLKAKSTTTTSANGLTVTTQSDLNGDAVVDRTQTTSTVKNTDGSSTFTATDTSSNGTLLDKTIVTTSANGLSVTTQKDVNGDGVVDRTFTDVTVINSDNSRTETVAAKSNNGTLLSQTVAAVSADRKTTTITEDLNGDGKTDRAESVVTGANGSVADTVSTFAPSGALITKSVVTTSANGLSVTRQLDRNGDGAYDLTTTDVTVLNADGSRTETIKDAVANGTLRDQAFITVSATGLSTTKQLDINGDGVFDLTTASVTVLNADGSSTTTVRDTTANGTLRDQTVTTVNASGLSTTVQSDLDGDGVNDRTITDTIALNADGSRTETATSTASNGALLAKSVTTTSADGWTVTSARDLNGDGKTDQTETVTRAASGSVTDKVVDLNPDGSVQDSVTSTTSANGTVSTVARDLDGDGTADRTKTSTLAYNADGSTTLTQADTSANGKLIDKTTTTKSASGLSATALEDLNGDGVNDVTVSDVTTLNTDGSTTETISRTSNTGKLLGKTVETVTADQKTITYTRDLNGDGANDQTETIALQTDGGTVDTIANYAPGGGLINKTISTTSANGLSVTSQIDVNGDGTYDLTRTDVTVLNGDGSRTETVIDKNANASVRDQSVSTTSANGLVSTVKTDLDGDGVYDLTTTSTTVLNADGSRTTTVKDTNANASLRDQSVTTVSANGLTKTTQVDLDGNGTFDQTVSDAIVLNADGSTIETVTAKNANGSLRSQSVTTTSADQSTVTVTRDLNGDSKLDQRETTTRASNGSVTDQVVNLNPDGTVKNGISTTTSADGLVVTVASDLNGDGVADKATSTSTVLNADGSVTKTVSAYSGTSLVSRTATTTSADGRSVATAYDLDGNGTVDLTTTDVIVLNTDGSTTETLTDTSANGTRRDQSTTTTSSDRKTISVATSVADNGSIQMQKTVAVQTDGSVKTTVTYPNEADHDWGSESDTRITSATGLSNSIVIKDRYGDYLNVTDAVTLNSDGSRTETFTDKDGWGYNSAITTSANGLSTSVSMTSGAYTGATAPDPKLTLAGSDVTVLNADGSRTETITDTITQTTSNSTSVKDKAVITTSANGLSKTTQLDVNNDGKFDRTDTISTAVDGSKTETIVINNPGSSALLQKDVITTSADGLTQALQRDSNGDGVFDHFESTATNNDGSVTGTIWDTNASGTLLDKFVTTTSANGLSKTTTSDVNGDGTVDFTQKAVTTLNADGSQTAVVTDTYANGAVKDRTVVTTSANGLSKTTRIDMNGDGVVDETQTDVTVVGADGMTTRTITNSYASGTLKDQTTVYNDTARYNSGIVTDFDTNGDGIIDKEAGVWVDQDGYKTESTTYYNTNGSTKAGSGTTTSPDGAIVNIWLSQNSYDPEDMIYYMPNANGSYEWSNYTSSVSQTATHTIDLNGIDNWVWVDLPASATTPVYHTTVIDLATEQKDIDIAQRLYDTALDRTMQIGEVQLLAEYITNGVLDTTTLANKITASSEFTTKYGTLTNLEFVERIYENAFNRAPTLAELNTWVGQLNANTATRAAVLIAVSQSEEHVLVGNVHQVTNNTDIGATGAYALDHTADSQTASDMVRRLYDTTLARSADASGLSTYSTAILNGSKTEVQVANALITSSEFTSKYGTLSNSAFVTQLFQNAVGRAPTSAESTFWTNALNAGSVSRADFVVGIAESSDHLAIMGAGYSTGGAGNDIIYAPDRVDTIDGGAGVNTLDFSLLSQPGVSVDLSTGLATLANGNVDHIANIQNAVGGAGNDTIAGNSANNVLTGGGGTNSFVFHGAFGSDTVTDFKATGANHDFLQFDVGAFATPSAALAASQQVGANVVIANGANSVTLNNVALSSLSAADFRVQ